MKVIKNKKIIVGILTVIILTVCLINVIESQVKKKQLVNQTKFDEKYSEYKKNLKKEKNLRFYQLGLRNFRIEYSPYAETLENLNGNVPKQNKEENRKIIKNVEDVEGAIQKIIPVEESFENINRDISPNFDSYKERQKIEEINNIIATLDKELQDDVKKYFSISAISDTLDIIESFPKEIKAPVDRDWVICGSPGSIPLWIATELEDNISQKFTSDFTSQYEDYISNINKAESSKDDEWGGAFGILEYQSRLKRLIVFEEKRDKRLKEKQNNLEEAIDSNLNISGSMRDLLMNGASNR